MTRVYFRLLSEHADIPPCPCCGHDEVHISEDWGYDPEYPEMCGYDVDCNACQKELGHISGPDDISGLFEEWSKGKRA